MNVLPLTRFGAILAAIVLFAGCSGSSGVPVTGSVNFEGQPVEQGAISFVDSNQKAPSEGATIVNGKFETVVTPGQKRVEIRASRPVKPNKNDPNTAGMREDFIPAKFNSASTLMAEISAEKENKLQFDLTAK